jgi:hypothetical protein
VFEDVEDDSVAVEVAFSFLVETFCLDESLAELLDELLDSDEVSTFFLIDFFDMTATE